MVHQTVSAIKDGNPALAVIVPVRDGAGTLHACLEAILSAPGPTRELIVIDDRSCDGSADIAAALGVRTAKVVGGPGGCAAARNYGVEQTIADVLVFVDADVVIHSNALTRIFDFMSKSPTYAAVFGSYDARPENANFVSQYRNLLHHFTHQSGNPEAKTFWTGVGAVRRPVFQAVGGFPSDCHGIEDIAFGLRLSDAGFRIRLDRQLLGTHLKAWTLRTMVATDTFVRAVPWSKLILSSGRMTNDLNTSVSNRLAVVLATSTVAFATLATISPTFRALAGLLFLATLVADIYVLKQFWKERGPAFTMGVVPLHFVHRLCSGIGFAIALTQHFLNARFRSWPLASRLNDLPVPTRSQRAKKSFA